MEIRSINKEYEFDDVLVVPNYPAFSFVNSRDDVTTFAYAGIYAFPLPIIASPMKGIISPELIVALGKLGGIGIMHRFLEPDERLKTYEYLSKQDIPWGAAVGLGETEAVKQALSFGARMICVDIANGYLLSLGSFCYSIADEIHQQGALLMTGNVVTYSITHDLHLMGVDMVRVGIGGGGLCTTRNVTGIGRPQVSAIMDCAWSDAVIVADGGVRNSGDIVKSLVAGADFVMIGSLLGTTFESANNGVIYGGASARLQGEYYQGRKPKTIEGMEKEVKKTRSLEDLLFNPDDGLIPGIRSAGTYLNSKTIQEFKTKGRFVEVGTGSIKDLSKFEKTKENVK